MGMRHDASTTLLVRALAVFIILIAATQLTTWWLVRSLSRDFDARAQRHLKVDVQRVRDRVKSTTVVISSTSLTCTSRRIAICHAHA